MHIHMGCLDTHASGQGVQQRRGGTPERRLVTHAGQEAPQTTQKYWLEGERVEESGMHKVS